MARTSKPIAAPSCPTRGETAILEFARSSLTPEQLKQRAAPLLNDMELLRDVWALTPEDQTKFVDKVDQAYPAVDPQNAKLITALGNVCSAAERLPTSAVLSAGLEKRGNIEAASGGLTDVWRGEYRGTQVAIKAFRIYPAQNLKEAKEILWKRVPVWRRLSHENILPFHGVNMTLFQFALVYDWGRNGNINQYITSHSGASRPSLLLDVAKGLQYLHSLDIPHGDLKGESCLPDLLGCISTAALAANVVVDRRGRARLTEYGLAPIISDPSFTVAATPGAVGTSRWLAPEIITPPRKAIGMPVMESKPADVFAFAMFAVEVFAGRIPFEEQKNEAVVLRISQGGRPEMPENAQAVGLTDEMWKVFESCWQQNPKIRPTMEEVVRRWQKLVEHTDNGKNGVTEKPQPIAEPSLTVHQRRAKSEAAPPRTRHEDARRLVQTEAVPARTRPENILLQAEFVQRGTKFSVIQQELDVFPRTKPEAVQAKTKSDVVAKPRTEPGAPLPNAEVPKCRRKWFCGLF